VFDSGSTDNAAFPDAAFLSGRRALRPGQHVSVWQNSTSRTPFWSFTTGTAASVNIVRVGTGPVAFMIAGVPAFYNFAVTFDAARGELLLSRPSASAATQTSHRAVPSSPWQRGAGELCTRLGHQAAIASQVGPSTPSNQSLRRKALALAFRLNTWARASLHTDRLLLQLRPPRALASKWRAAIVSDQAGATIMLRFAPAASTYRTETAYERAVRRFAARYHAAEQTWSTVIAQIGMTACT
jgi:hypothetical protein